MINKLEVDVGGNALITVSRSLGGDLFAGGALLSDAIWGIDQSGNPYIDTAETPQADRAEVGYDGFNVFLTR